MISYRTFRQIANVGDWVNPYIIFLQNNLGFSISQSVIYFDVSTFGVGNSLAKPLDINILPVSSEGRVLRDVYYFVDGLCDTVSNEDIEV